ncbi:flagellar basal body rod protein FlgC [Desulfovibrio sulfodismutans]|uniref:Flagellar basal-body rod protein FlgC n=1 Tax=Desulfolutivibrio sulfodismutans TaxID=63561 RepID=A0A7K3NI60_9BACT|nr:flagellar basal body rod protein FlgC [Desulfolutivibrio sulfodismutans]NDY55777.1 flagellar basal body rod protein FlgC [Desulfolutivibrio sulfodismutans]QLA13394.1 flagellar basal body rod protein FlgC [Desulfolutivibrio sulfodismutans DSM 3696]
MDFSTALDIGSSALSAQRTNLNVISMNLANIRSTKTANGEGPYQRKSVVFESTPVDTPFSKAMQGALDRDISGVKVTGVVNDNRPPRLVFEPGHPDADENGYVAYPDINVVEEMANMITTMRSYEASAASISTTKSMFSKALEIGR